MAGGDDFVSTITKAFKNSEDDRVADWFLMSNSHSVLTISAVYVVVCKYLGPLIMQNRKPFSLKNIIIGYNILQIISCFLLVNKILKDDLWIFSTIEFDPKVFNRIEIVEVCHWALYLKLIELVETVFFTMRKKQSQITNLHLYHHATTFLFVWLGIKYSAGLAMGSFVLLNSIVHLVMYGYYLVAAIGSKKIQKLVNPFKKYLTIIQMIQFALLLYITMNYMIFGNTEAWVLGIAFLPNVVLVFYLFYEFYKKSYNNTTSVTSKSGKNH